MAYQSSAAYRLDTTDYDLIERAPRPSLDVIEGGGADARVRRGLSAPVVSRLKLFAIAMATFVLVGLVRVAVTARTVSELTENVTLEHQIAEAESSNSDLRIGRSILSSSARIDRIAVENYGMVYATDRDVIDLDEAPSASAAAMQAAQEVSDPADEVDPDGASADEPEAVEADLAS